jgi:hypothetical protein
MRVKKMILDESMLDNFESEALLGKWIDTPEIGPGLQTLQAKGLIDTYDDEFIDLEGVPSGHLEEPIPGPATGAESGIVSMLIDAMNDEWETINKYNSIVTTLRDVPEVVNPEGFINVIEEIISEENRHAGQLQELIKQISPNAVEVTNGQKEARAQLNQFVGGKLQVQSWDTPTPQGAPNEISELCSLSDIDDEM